MTTTDNDQSSRQYSIRALMLFTLAVATVLGFGSYFGFEPAMWFGQALALALIAFGLYCHNSQYVARSFGLFLVFLGLTLSGMAYRIVQPDSSQPIQLVYFGIFPGLPLFVIGLVPLIAGSRAIGGRLYGALAGALVAMVVPYGMMWYASKNYSGGGANIGLMFLLLALPLYLPVAMAVGAGLATVVGRIRSAQAENEASSGA